MFSGIAKMVQGMTGGQNPYKARSFSNDASSGYDPNAKNYGGQPGGAQQYSNEMRLNAGGADARNAPLANYGETQAFNNQAALARGGQQQATNLIMNRATGATPSIAGQQSAADFQRLQNQSRLDNQMLQQNAQQQSQQALAANAAQASSARGAAGVALAGQQAANNTANAQAAIARSTANASQNMGLANMNAGQQISQQAQVNAANERMQAEQAALGGYGTMRAGDLSQVDSAAQRAQYQSNQQLQSRQLNDQRSMGYEQLGARATEAQLNANMQDQSIQANSHNITNNLEFQRNQGNIDRKQQAMNAGAEGIGGFFDNMGAMAMLSDTRAKQQTLLAKGRAQGAAMAGVDPADVAAIRDRNSIDSMLDDRYQQNETGPDTVGRGALDDAIGRQVQADKFSRFDSVDDPLPARSDDPVAQWERSFGKGQAANDARTHDNLVEMQKTRARLSQSDQPTLSPGGRRQGAPPWAAMFSGGMGPPPRSDARAKEAAEAKGFAKGQAEAHQQIADSRMAQAARFGAAGLVSPGHMLAAGVEAARSVKPQARASEAASKAGPTEASKREPNKPESSRKGLVIERGKETQGLPSKATPVAEMMTRPSELRTPYDTSRHFAAPQETLALLPGRANGGRVKADTMYRVGEEGEEAFVPDVDGTIIPNDELESYEAPSRMKGLGEDFNYRQFMGDMDSRLAAAQEAKRNEPKSMKRDSAADQKRIGDAYASRLSSEADEYIAAMRASTGRGASVALDEGEVDDFEPERSAVADANRAMRGEPYAYRPEYTPPNERSGQPHFGFMAQNLEKSPVSATAVEEGPDGMKRVDRDRMLQVVAAGVADLQRQQDETRLALRKGGRR
jgi:hypothetical protein